MYRSPQAARREYGKRGAVVARRRKNINNRNGGMKNTTTRTRHVK